MIRIKSLLRQIQTYVLTHKKQTAAAAGVLVVAVYSLVFFVPKSVDYSYGGEACISKLTLLPGIHHESNESAYDIEYTGGSPLYATKACFTPHQAPEEGTARVAAAPWGGWLARTNFKLRVPAAPVANVAPLKQPVPATKPIELALDQPDEVFDYLLRVDDKTTTCQSESKLLACDITELDLKQGSKYDATLVRAFEDTTTDELHAGTLETLRPIKVVKTSVKKKQTVYSKPKSLTIETDKPLKEASATLTQKQKDGDPKEIAVKTEFDDKKLTIAFEKDLPRSSDYTLTLDELTADDGSTLVEPYEIPFKTSDGPEFTGASVGSTKAPASGSITLGFDQAISQKQDISKFVSVSGANATILRGKSSVTVQYSGAGRCSPISITIKKGLESKHGVVQGSPTTFKTRTLCYVTETIGYSHQGRPITAYFFGNGSKTALFTGAIHGSEKSSYDTTMSWINELESRAAEIPKDKQVVVVPMLNPDGYYVYGRDNSRKVNLNRNFPASNWEKDITVSGGKEDKGGGGRSAGSERETQVLMSLVNRLNPYITVTYHSQGALVNSNSVAPAASLGSRYAGLAGYGFVPDEATVATFGFAMTGTFEDWMAETGRAALLIELPSHYGDYLGQNRAGMWSVVRS